ncbi:CDP-diacylglycerol--glycerol-3-phosphate 3-phosphatidyltransferase [Tropicimonas isoalkanivorans]|uniref:CDP-diacylglycerol--glycerol-3-phosphate 3-phosphatidyltransferase n=1 Tax=Tropicimonas isoalkanivorans TaxID=441112 RepID=A0A1I1N7H5_9RHOB|nr:CDP-diacylglycerol--glycerol-3-phosphate 3-phosphatidyltransferase [Tropicimonas isoalkanivorans]SFC93306.1 CDP-diacylglycerol--glycerol-3-phosphate 3-phosphatidyltransferase [Tropicimonas isoalkanivorans]
MTWTLPNILTVFRLAAAPLVLLAFVLLPRPMADWTALALFIGASVTDYIDGHLARRWDQRTKLGTMLDPIADKAIVVIAIAALFGHMGFAPLLAIPAAVILLREVFVSGLREFLGDTAGTLKVTKLAKWKTMVQMVAISVLLAYGGLQSGGGATELGNGPTSFAAGTFLYIGLLFLWIAAGLTAITGWDYFSKARPYLKD